MIYYRKTLFGSGPKLTAVHTWKAPKPSYRLDTKRLEAEHPDLSSQYQMLVSNSRRLIIKELKSDKYKNTTSKESL